MTHLFVVDLDLILVSVPLGVGLVGLRDARTVARGLAGHGGLAAS